MHPGQQDDQLLTGLAQLAEQARPHRVVERQHRRRLEGAACQRRGEVGEQRVMRAAAVERLEPAA
jgi:hypothetical protein